MANTKGKGLILEIGETVTITDSGQVIETNPIFETETTETIIYGDVYVGDSETPIGWEYIQTGTQTITELDNAETDWFRLSGLNSSFLNDGPFFLETV